MLELRLVYVNEMVFWYIGEIYAFNIKFYFSNLKDMLLIAESNFKYFLQKEIIYSLDNKVTASLLHDLGEMDTLVSSCSLFIFQTL